MIQIKIATFSSVITLNIVIGLSLNSSDSFVPIICTIINSCNRILYFDFGIVKKYNFQNCDKNKTCGTYDATVVNIEYRANYENTFM